VTKVRSVLAAALVAALVAGCTAAEDGDDGGNGVSNEGWTPEYVDGVLQPLPDGFPSQPIVLVNPDAPGHDDGLYARAMQAALEGISPVSIEVQDLSFPTFGTWAGIQHMQNQPGGTEGYYAQVTAFVGTAVDILTEPIEDEFGMSLADLNPVIATERTPFVLVTRADAPWQTYQELVDAATAAPGELRYVAATGSLLDIGMERLMAEGGWTANKIPAGASVEAATAVAAGEGDFTMLTPSVARSHQEAGKVRVLLVITPEDEPPPGYEGAVTTGSLGLRDEPWVSYRGWIVPPETPQAHIDWLFELFRKGSEQPEPQERVDNLPGADIITLDADELRKIMDDALAFSEPIVRDLGLHHEQN
jgi:tripartite-type tricarboxylate transporter receptor subunit TctC